MDKRSYNVDDILADIKSRKARLKKENPAMSGQTAAEHPQESASRGTDKPAPPPYIPPSEREVRPNKPPEEKKPSRRLEFGHPVPGLTDRAEPERQHADVEGMTGIKNPAKDLLQPERPKRPLPYERQKPAPVPGDEAAGRLHKPLPYERQKPAPAPVPGDEAAGRLHKPLPYERQKPAPTPVPGDEAAGRLHKPLPYERQKPAPPAPAPDEEAAKRVTSGLEAPTRVLPKVSDLKTVNQAKTTDFGKFALESDAIYEDGAPDDMPEGSVIDYSEYNSLSDRRDVQRDIAHVKLWLFFRVAATLVLNIALLLFTLSGRYGSIPLPEALWPVPETMRAYLMACTVLTILTALVCSSSVGGGLIGLFRGHANSDTLAALAILAAIGQGVSAVSNYETVDPEKLNLYFSAAALAMLFNGIGKMNMINRILTNFKIVADENEPKKAILNVENDDFCHEFIKDASMRRPVIAHSVNAGFFSDFLALSYSDKYDVGINRAVAPVCLVGSIVVGAATYFLSGSVFSGISAFCAVLCVCATLSSTFIENVPLSKLTKKLAPEGGMVSGHKAVEDFCDTRAIILTENDLFPKGNVRMHGIRAFSSTRVDEAISDAASVLCAVDGTLGPLFLEMIGGNRKLLKKVDNIIFENGMGVSAWVDQRRVLIGNRKLMLNHGISLPAEAAAQKHSHLSAEAEPLFLSNSGEASAQFTVSYHIDEELALQLDKLALKETLLIVKTMDANITSEKIWELYGYPMELIRILPAEWHPAYNQMTAPKKTAIAKIVYPALTPAVFIRAILACAAARSSILSATVIQLIQIVLGYALVTFMSFMGSIGSISITEIYIYQLFWFIAIFIAQKTRQS